MIEWVCGFLLTLQGPLHPTPARKQIKLQFHHLEGAVSCPNAAPPSLHTHTHTHTPFHIYTHAHKTLHLRLIRAAQLPRPQNASLFPLLNCREEWRDLREERGKEGDGWFERQRGLGVCTGILLQLHPSEIFCCGESVGRERQKGYTAVASR